MLPYASLDLDPDNGPIQASSANLGDLLVSPFLQWDPIMGPKGPRLMQRIELHGYYLKEFTDKRLDGKRIKDSQEQVLGLGPGLVYHLSKHDHIFFNAYWETEADNRPEGSRFNLRYVHHFH